MNNVDKSQNKIAVDVVLLPPDSVMNKAVELNQMLETERIDYKISLNKHNCLPHISLGMGCINKAQLPEIDLILKKIAERYIPINLNIQDICISQIPTGEKVTSFNIMKTEKLQSLHETIMNSFSCFFTQDVFRDIYWALSDEDIKEFTIQWVKNYLKDASFDKYCPHITLGFGDIKMKVPNPKIPVPFRVTKLALCHLGDHCTCREIFLMYDCS